MSEEATSSAQTETVPLAVEVRDLHKSFRIPIHRVQTLKEKALHPFRKDGYRVQHVLDGIDFDVKQGEFFGIVGRNGSGKSTLLKCMAGIYGSDAGSIHIAGSMAPFIELGVGFNPDLTARENVEINGVMMGMTARGAREAFDDVIAFAELEDFVDLKLKNYSSGMQVRLAFALMVRADTDIMLIDEVLAVGDAAFQQKCLDEFYRMRNTGKTVVLVTHDMGTVERFCDRAMMIADGRITLMGDPAEVGRAYLRANFDHGHSPAAVSTEVLGVGAHIPEPDAEAIDLDPAGVLRAQVAGSDGEFADTNSVAHGDPFTVRITFLAHEDLTECFFSIWIANADGTKLFSATAGLPDSKTGVHANDQFEVDVNLPYNPLNDGHFYVGCSGFRGSSGEELIVHTDLATDFISFGSPNHRGAVALAHTTESRMLVTPGSEPQLEAQQ